MQGSKYTQEQREQVAALLAGGMSATAVSKKTGIPRATVCDWRARALESGDEDYLAERREKLRKLMAKSWSVVGYGLSGIEKTVRAADKGGARIETMINKILKADAISSDDSKELVKLLRGYNDVSLNELSRATGDAMKIYDALEAALVDGAGGTQQIKIEFDDPEGLAE